MVRAKNEEIFSLREKNRKKDIQIVLLKDQLSVKQFQDGKLKNDRPRSSPQPIRSAPVNMNGQMKTVLPVNGGQTVVNKVRQVNGGHLINNGGQIVRKVQNVTNLNQLKIPAGSKLIQVGNQKIVTKLQGNSYPTVTTNATQFTTGFNQQVHMVRKIIS